MIHRIEITSKVVDTRAGIRKKKLEAMGFRGKIENVWLVDVYTIEKKLTSGQLQAIAEALSNPVSQTATVNKPQIPRKFTWAVEIGFLPGVTDNVANTARKIIEDLLKIKFGAGEGVYTSQLMFILGNLSSHDINLVADGLMNPLIQRVVIKNFREFKNDGGMEKIVPKVKLKRNPRVDVVDLNVDDEQLKVIGKAGIANKDGTRRGPLALDLTYLKTIQAYFRKQGRNPTDIELESIAQTWSEHCKHTIFSDPIDDIKEGLFKRYIKRATDEIRKKKGKKDFCVSVFTDNSGAIDFNKDYLVTHKVETHNSPSALDPFGGAITGIVGVNRDAIGFGLGAKPIVNTYGFCFADPASVDNFYRNSQLTQKLLSARRIMEGVIEGVNSGGNCSGIPTPQGFVFFDPRYRGKPLVFVGTIGLIPKRINDKPAHLKKAEAGDYIVMVGGRVGLDGIHGATFSSEALDSGSPAGAVQIGDPITQKKLSDALVKEARDLRLYHSITDNGAGGLSCSVAEMARESGGCEVDLEKVPLKYPGLNPWQIWISESQERMTLSIPKNKWQKFSDLMKRRGVEATIIGLFTDSGKCLVKYKNRVVMAVEMDFLHDGLPPRPMKTIRPQMILNKPKISRPKDLNKVILRMLSSPNIASFEFISQQYDHEVQGTSVLKPLQGRGRVNAEATVLRPVLGSQKGIVISQGIYPNYSDIDTYYMAACAIDTAIRNVVAAGADIDNLALLDNFCWCSSNDPVRLYQLKKAAQACFDYATVYKTPFISGKDSMFNDFSGFDQKGNPVKISIPPTLLISSIGVVEDVTKTISLDVKFPNDLIYILGETNISKVNALKNRKLYQAFYNCVNSGLISSSISIGRGGLAIALAKIAMGGMLGVEVSLDNFSLFSESQGRILATVAPKNKKEFEKLMANNSIAQIGKVTNKNNVVISNLVNIDLHQALKAYKSKFKDF